MLILLVRPARRRQTTIHLHLVRLAVPSNILLPQRRRPALAVRPPQPLGRRLAGIFFFTPTRGSNHLLLLRAIVLVAALALAIVVRLGSHTLPPTRLLFYNGFNVFVVFFVVLFILGVIFFVGRPTRQKLRQLLVRRAPVESLEPIDWRGLSVGQCVGQQPRLDIVVLGIGAGACFNHEVA